MLATRDHGVTLCECAARDGLQHEAAFVPTRHKIALIDAFSALGFPRIEVTSFSHPRHVPQFSDAEEVLRGIQRRKGVFYKATCVNQRAVERALAAAAEGFGPTEISFVISASEAHNLKNAGRTRGQSMEEAKRIVARALEHFRVVATISTAFACPFSGPVSYQVVHELVSLFASLGVQMICIGDTTGYGYPDVVERRFGRLLEDFPRLTFVGHFHDTRGAALANITAALRAGVRHFDSSFGGLGGHPARITYGEGYTGNAVTEDLVCLLEAMGYQTGLNLERLVETGRDVEATLGRQLSGRVTRSGPPWEIVSASPPYR